LGALVFFFFNNPGLGSGGGSLLSLVVLLDQDFLVLGNWEGGRLGFRAAVGVDA
jgi:hypothetical protein